MLLSSIFSCTGFALLSGFTSAKPPVLGSTLGYENTQMLTALSVFSSGAVLPVSGSEDSFGHRCSFGARVPFSVAALLLL